MQFQYEGMRPRDAPRTGDVRERQLGDACLEAGGVVVLGVLDLEITNGTRSRGSMDDRATRVTRLPANRQRPLGLLVSRERREHDSCYCTCMYMVSGPGCSASGAIMRTRWLLARKSVELQVVTIEYGRQLARDRVDRRKLRAVLVEPLDVQLVKCGAQCPLELLEHRNLDLCRVVDEHYVPRKTATRQASR